MIHSPAELENLIRQEIPALREYTFTIASNESGKLEVSSSLSEHLNHKGTAFGGSIYQVALVSCYALCLQGLLDAGLSTRNFVIASANINYLKPVTANFIARAEVDPKIWQDFLTQLRGVGKARLPLESSVRVGDLTCASLRAQFVVWK